MTARRRGVDRAGKRGCDLTAAIGVDRATNGDEYQLALAGKRIAYARLQCGPNQLVLTLTPDGSYRLIRQDSPTADDVPGLPTELATGQL